LLQLLAIVNLIAAVQSAFLLVHFVLKKKGILTLNRLIALLCFCFTFVLANTFINLYAVAGLRLVLIQDIVNNTMWFIGPSLYLYATFNQIDITNKRLATHFLPYLILSLIDIFFQWEAYDQVIRFIAFMQMCTYLVSTILFCIRNHGKERGFFSWILPAIGTYLILVLINFILSVLLVFDIELINNSVLQSFTILLVIPIFYIAYKEMNSTGSFDVPSKKYGTTPIDEERANEILSSLKSKLEEEKGYQRQDLTLSKLSEEINIPSKYISQVVNQKLNMSFSDYLVQLRIAEVKDNLLNPEKGHLTISGIAEEAGFTSGSRFNYLFKKRTGYTPSAYIRAHNKE
jgi:AraC-like DNA-binding protein